MRWTFCLAIVIFMLGCKNHSKEGVEIIPAPQMTTLLWDMIQVDEFATANLLKDSTKVIKLERIKLYEQVFKLHKVCEKDFSASFKYYAGRPDIMKSMFDTLSARGERERRNMYLPKSVAPK